MILALYIVGGLIVWLACGMFDVRIWLKADETFDKTDEVLLMVMGPIALAITLLVLVGSFIIDSIKSSPIKKLYLQATRGKYSNGSS